MHYFIAFALSAAVTPVFPVQAQEQAQIAMLRPQPHFVASWAPREERAAERAAVLAARVSLRLTSVSLNDALEELTAQAGLRIVYSQSILPSARRVTLNAGDIAVFTALTEMLFRSGLDVLVDQDGTLALVACRHATVSATNFSGSIVGLVTDRATGAPLAGATVALSPAKQSTATDADGHYRLASVAAGSYAVRARYIGYTELTVPARVTEGLETVVNLALERSIQRLEELVTVTPGGAQTDAKSLPTPISVITAEDIERQQPRTLPQLLRESVPGMVSFDVASRPEQSAFAVRGASTISTGANQMKVLVDGIQLAQPDDTPVDPANIERIEVIRGPQGAAVYGSDAVGGVIQIFTKRGAASRKPQVDLEAGAGIAQTPYDGFTTVLRQRHLAAVRGGSTDMTYSVGIGYARTGEWLPDDEVSSQSNPNINAGTRFAFGAFAVDLSGRYGVTNSHGAVNPEIRRTGFVPFSAPQFLRTAKTNQAVGARINLRPAASWQHSLTLGFDNFDLKSTQERQRFTSPEDTLLSLSLLTANRSWLAYNNSLSGSLGTGFAMSIQSGIEYNNLSTSFASASRSPEDASRGVIAGAAGSELSAENTGVFGQAQLSIQDNLTVTGGLRAEWNDGFGDNIGTPMSPRIGASYFVPAGAGSVRVRGSWGRAIRPPPAENRLGDGASVLPNPELGPERQNGWDGGVDLEWAGAGIFRITYFDQTAQNLIQFVQVQTHPQLRFQWQNVGRVRNRGIEVEGATKFEWLDVKANYAYTRARVEELPPGYSGNLRIGDQVPLAPRHTVGILVGAQPRAGTNISAGLAFVGGVRQTDFVALFRCLGGTAQCTPDFNFDVEYPGFVKVNLTLSQRLTRQLSTLLQVDNLTNNMAFEGGNIFPSMGRITMVGLRFRS